MELIRGLYNLRARQRRSVVTIGNYDGLHLGHRAVIGRVRALAAELGVVPAVVTFDPLPREVLAERGPPGRVQTSRDRLAGLDGLGVGRVLLLRFDAQLAAMSAEAFAREVLGEGLGAECVVAGADFRFGQGRAGDRALLETLGFGVETPPEVISGGQRVSSTRIRLLLAAGDLDGAEALLGRRWSVSGRVGHGDGLGRTLGYPTANLRPGPLALARGVYAVRVRRATGQVVPGVASWGTRPTVGGTGLVLELHLFDSDADLYGERLEVEPVRHLRDEVKFEDVDKMKAQMARDVEDAKRVLAAWDRGAKAPLQR